MCVYGCVCVGISSSVCAEPWLIPADDPLVLVTSFERSLSITGAKRIVDQLTEGAALLIGLKILVTRTKKREKYSSG